MPGGFDQPTAAAACGIGLDAAVGPRHVVGPDDHLATVALHDGIGFQHCLGSEIRHLRIRHQSVAALVIAAHADHATAIGTRHIDESLVGDGDAIAQHVHMTADTAGGDDLACAFHDGVTAGLQHHGSAIKTGRRRLYFTAVAQGAGKDADRIALQPAQVAHLVARRLNEHGDALEPASGDLDLLAGRQHRAAIGGLDQCAGTDLDIRRHQHHVAVMHADAAVHAQGRHAAQAIAKTQPSCERIRVAHAQGRRCKAGGVDDGPSADRNAGLVHQHYASVGRQAAEDAGGRIGDDPVYHGAAGARLLEHRAVTCADRKTLPVDGRMVGTRAVLGGDLELVRGRGAGAHLAVYGHPATGVGLCQNQLRLQRKCTGQG